MRLEDHQLALIRYDREPKCDGCGRPEIWHTPAHRTICPRIFW